MYDEFFNHNSLCWGFEKGEVVGVMESMPNCFGFCKVRFEAPYSFLECHSKIYLPLS